MNYKINKNFVLKAMITIVILFISFSLTACSQFTQELSKYDDSRYKGEWHDEKAGYFVFNKNNTFRWYKDKSQSEDNVYLGKWEVQVVEQNNGETLPYIILDKKEEIVDGNRTVLKDYNDNRNKIEMAVVEYSEDLMKIINLNTRVQYNLAKQ